MVQYFCFWTNHSGLDQSVSDVWAPAGGYTWLRVSAVHSQQQLLMKRLDIVDTASIVSELESFPSLKEKQRTALKAFLNGENDFSLLTWLALATALMAMDRWFIQSPAKPIFPNNSQLGSPGETNHLVNQIDFQTEAPEIWGLLLWLFAVPH